MDVAVLGGTGDIGEGLALRLARDTDHDILIGSRDSENARDAAAAYTETLTARGIETTLTGMQNETAADRGDVVILGVPPYYAGDTVEAVAPQLDADTVLVTPAVGMQGDADGLHYHPPESGSVTELVATRAPAAVPVVGAFHTLPAASLADLDVELDLDVPIVADDEAAAATVTAIVEEIDGVRALSAGPLTNAAAVERLTPLAITIAKHNDGIHDVGVKWT